MGGAALPQRLVPPPGVLRPMPRNVPEAAGGGGTRDVLAWGHQTGTQPRAAGTWGRPRSSHLGEGGVLALGEQPGEEGGAVEAHDGGDHQVTVREVKEENTAAQPWGQRWGHERSPEGYKMRTTCRAAPKDPKMEKETWPRGASCRGRRARIGDERSPGQRGTRVLTVPCPPAPVPGCPAASRHRPAAAPGRGSRR